MADQQWNYPPQSQPKLYERNESENDSIIATDAHRTDNLCYELLAKICEFLDPESLLNVADTCKRLQIAAATQFGDRFGDNYIWFLKSDLTEKTRTSGVYLGNGEIDVIGIKFALRFLRCFGGKIAHLEHPFSYIRNNNFQHYINHYCADTVTSITSYGEETFPIENCSNPFRNVEKLAISEVNLRKQLRDLMKLFPNLRHLEMTDIQIDENAFAVCFPRLNHLTLKVDASDGCLENEFTAKNSSQFLRANRQLQSLDLFSFNRITFNELLDMISKNALLLKLQMSGEHTEANAADVEKFVNEHPLIEELYLPDCVLTVDNATKLISRLSALKEFEIQFRLGYEHDKFVNQLGNKWQHSVISRGSQHFFWAKLKH